MYYKHKAPQYIEQGAPPPPGKRVTKCWMFPHIHILSIFTSFLSVNRDRLLFNSVVSAGSLKMDRY